MVKISDLIYGHSFAKVPIGNDVRPGQYIGITDSVNNHLHFGLKNNSDGSIYINPIHYFEGYLRQGILQAMRGNGGYDPEYTAYSMISFDRKYSDRKYWFWCDDCEKWTGIVMENSFWNRYNRWR